MLEGVWIRTVAKIATCHIYDLKDLGLEAKKEDKSGNSNKLGLRISPSSDPRVGLT